MHRPHVAYVIDPRFPGGTSSAVAAEIKQVATFARVSVHGLETSMFKGRDVAPQLATALNDLGLEVIWDNRTISADTVLLHNPSCLRFQDALGVKIAARQVIVVTHENFVRPSGAEAFDVGLCLDQILQSSFALRFILAPLSGWNREAIKKWDGLHGHLNRWSVLDTDWFNICDFEFKPPNTVIKDRRGRLSRPGFEKFPQDDVMRLCFPSHAESNVILGADTLMLAANRPAHWTLFPFRGLDVKSFFDMIDFMVYFTAPTLRESFGRVLAEGIAAGKIVISDPETAKTFGGGVVAASPDTVDQVVKGYIDNPKKYAADVAAAQAGLRRFSGEEFLRQHRPLLTEESEVAA
ncbi:MAG: hypothetical protein OXQ30_02435 [Boseongicola sp.]|nr:hypothetical protein [Boseongicola sp.]